MSVLVIAQKPSVARDIARVIGATERGEGCLSGNGYVVSWAIGHLIGIQNPEEIDEKYKKWRKDTLPILPEKLPLKVLPKTGSQFRLLKKLMNSSQTESIVCATDSGREGELIFRYIYEMAGCKKSILRLWISSLTDESIKKGFSELKPSVQYDNLYASARCRSQADWLIGMNASRAFTLRYNALLSIGRVQTPTLNILVKRRREIDQFKPEAYYLVNVQYPSFMGTWFDKTKEGFQKKIINQDDAQRIAALVSGKTAKVLSLQKTEKKEIAPQLYDLTTLQRDASSILSFTAAKTLKIAQSLYEKHKLLTYPRTDSRYLSHDIQQSVKKALLNLPQEYSALAQPLLEKPIPMIKRVFDDAKLTDHHAIIPTGKKANMDTLSDDEKKLYDLVVRRLMAAFYPAYRYETVTLVAECCEERFVSEGITVLEEGFKVLYKGMKKSAKQDKSAWIGKATEGDEMKIKSAKVKSEMTKPPSEHTDASLLSEMEHAGRTIEDEALREEMKAYALGTPATRAAIIERLIEVDYARRKGKQIIATEKGCNLIDTVPQQIASPEITGKWEQALEKIAVGDGDSVRFMDGIRKMAAFLVQYADEKASAVVFQQEERKGKKHNTSHSISIGVTCPACQKGEIVENEKAFGCSLWKQGCKLTLWKNQVTRAGGPVLTASIVKALMNSDHRSIKGSTGVLAYQNGQLSFFPKE